MSTSNKRSKSGGSNKRLKKSVDYEKKLQKQLGKFDEEIFSGDDEDITDVESVDGELFEYGEPKEETEQEKKVRLVKKYLKKIKDDNEEKGNEQEDLDIIIGDQLKEDILESAGQMKHYVTDKCLGPDAPLLYLKSKHHKRSVTCIAVAHNEKFFYSASKDCSIVKWNFEGKKIGFIKPAHKLKKEAEKKNAHKSTILSLAVSSDGKFLASGDKTKIIHIWDGNSLAHINTLIKHRDAVSSLAFRRGTHMLFSASHDRTVMIWDLDEMAFVDYMGGHQDSITSVSSLWRETCITTGGRDLSVIVYVIPQERQLRYFAPVSHISLDAVALLNQNMFVTISQGGKISLWKTLKKKPFFTLNKAHGCPPGSDEPHWISALAVVVNGDMIATGSMDGFIRFWKVDTARVTMTSMFEVAVNGIVNSLQFTDSGSHLVAAVGQDHTHGRWFKMKEARNQVVVIPILYESEKSTRIKLKNV